LDVHDIHDEIEHSANLIKKDIITAAKALKTAFGIG